MPLILRSAEENNFHLVMRARNFCLLFFIGLSGSFTHLCNYFVHDKCLHTIQDPNLITSMTVSMVDFYQYCLVSLIWFISAPLIAYGIFNFFRDVGKYICIPFIITGIVFMTFAGLISAVAIFNIMLNGNSWLTRSAFLC